MAELYAEQQRYYNFRARELDAEDLQRATRATRAPSRTSSRRSRPTIRRSADQWLLAAVKEYLEVADHPDNYGSYKRMDEVLFYLAYLLTQVKKEEAARKYFKRLIKDYPKSRFIPTPSSSFGEYFFEQKQLEDALKFYDKVLQYPESRVYGYAKYKEGWVLLQPRRLQAGARDLRERHRAEREAGRLEQQGQKLALGKEAKKDSVRAYARIGTPEKAWPFFQRIGGDYAMTMMEQLGELYNAQGQFQDSIKVYRQLMALDADLAEALLLADRGHEEHAVGDRLARARRTTSRSCSASPPSTRRSRTRRASRRTARGVPRQHREHARASSPPSGTRKRRRPTTTTPTRSRSTSIRST